MRLAARTDSDDSSSSNTGDCNDSRAIRTRKTTSTSAKTVRRRASGAVVAVGEEVTYWRFYLIWCHLCLVMNKDFRKLKSCGLISLQRFSLFFVFFLFFTFTVRVCVLRSTNFKKIQTSTWARLTIHALISRYILNITVEQGISLSGTMRRIKSHETFKENLNENDSWQDLNWVSARLIVDVSFNSTKYLFMCNNNVYL